MHEPVSLDFFTQMLMSKTFLYQWGVAIDGVAKTKAIKAENLIPAVEMHEVDTACQAAIEASLQEGRRGKQSFRSNAKHSSYTNA